MFSFSLAMSDQNQTSGLRVISTEPDEDMLQRITEAAIDSALHRARRCWEQEQHDATADREQCTAVSQGLSDASSGAVSRGNDSSQSTSSSFFSNMPSLSRTPSGTSSGTEQGMPPALPVPARLPHRRQHQALLKPPLLLPWVSIWCCLE